MVPFFFLLFLGPFSGLSQHFYEVEFACSAPRDKNGRDLQKCFNFSALGYQANIDSSDTLGAMNFQMWEIFSGSPGSLVRVISIQEMPFLAYM